MVLPITDRPIWKGRLPRWQARATQCFVVRGLLRRLPPALHIVAAIGLHSLPLAQQRVRGCPLTRAHGVPYHARHKTMAGTRTPAVAVFLAAAPTFVRAHLLAPVLACLLENIPEKHCRMSIAFDPGRMFLRTHVFSTHRPLEQSVCNPHSSSTAWHLVQ